MPEVNEVPTYQPPEGVHGPTLGRDLPDGCERLWGFWDPHTAPADRWLANGVGGDEYLFWWRFPPLKVGDRVQLTGTVTKVFSGSNYTHVKIDNSGDYWFLTRVVTP